MKNLPEFVTRLQLAGIQLKQGEPMCRHTSFQIGGPVAVMVFPESTAQLKTILNIARELDVVPMIMGAGSNILAPDQGLDTVMIETRTNMTGIELLEGDRIRAQCGVTLARLATFAMNQGLTGLEFAHGIPGTLGGGVYMNAGAYGGEMAQVLDWAEVLFPDEGIRRIPAGEMAFAYRHSLLTDRPDAVVLRSQFRLTADDSTAIRSRMEDLMARRKASQPLEFPSAGSTFKRPTGHYAAALIDGCGLKGLSIGGAEYRKNTRGSSSTATTPPVPT